MLLLKSSNHSVVSVLYPSNHTQIYNRIKTLLSQEEFALLSCPNIFADSNQWTIEANLRADQIQDFNKLSPDDQASVADTLEQLKTDILNKLATTDLKALSEKLFIIPKEENIKVIREGLALKPILTQWAYRSTEHQSTVNPLSTIIARPRPNRDKVIIEVQYTNGAKAADKTIFIEYKGVEGVIKTNKDGLKDMGQFLFNSEFSIYDKVNNQKAFEHSFRASENGKYLVIIPLFAKGSVKVLDQKGVLMPDTAILIHRDGQESEYSTGKTGVLNLENLEVGKEIKITEKENLENTQTYTISKEKNDFVLKAFRPLFANATIEVKDENDETQFHFHLLIDFEGKQKEYNTGEKGLITLENLGVGKEIKIINKNKIDNFLNFTVSEENNHWVLKIVKPVQKFVRVKLINHNNQPLPNIPIDFTYNNQTASFITDNNGICTLAHESFIDQEKVKALIHLPANNKKKEKLVKKDFIFKTEQLEYIIKLNKISRLWWLLLLLLLPLLLLVRCEKAVHVKATNSETKKAVKNADVYFQYEKAFLYDSGSVLTSEEMQFNKKTDSLGIASFQKLEYSFYSFVFKNTSKAFTFVVSGCYKSDTDSSSFHWISNNDTLFLSLKPHIIPLDFLITDTEDNEPLPNSKVDIIAEFDGKQYIDSAISQADGRVVFNNLPSCGIVREIKASLEGYYSDSITNREVEKLLGDLKERRNLKLKPIKKPIIFFVIDCQSKQPIPDATITIDFEWQSKKKTLTKKTNVNGVGKGEYEDAHIIADITLTAEKKYYKKGTLSNKYKVEEFLKLPQDKRTICLEPEENCTEFKNIDEKTGKPLSGVKNIVKITNGSNSRMDTLLSNANGIFKICVKTGDKISIIATYPPDYEDNTTKVKDADGIKLLEGNEIDRTIPLKLREVEIIFRVIDAETGALIPGADLKVLFDDVLQASPTNSGTGEFKVKVLINALVSIVASKTDYGANSTKINMKPAKFLVTALQSERDIPLEKEKISPPKKGCRAFFTGGLIGEGKGENMIQPYKVDDLSELVGEGEYPDNSIAFPKSVATTFDGIAIDEGTRVIIYSESNFGGRILLDVKGPIIINNIKFKDVEQYSNCNNAIFPDIELQKSFPPNTRIWSSENMQPWSNGSVKVICEQ